MQTVRKNSLLQALAPTGRGGGGRGCRDDLRKLKSSRVLLLTFCFLSVFFHVLFCFSYYCSLATVKIYFLSFSCFLCLISLSVSLTTVLPLFPCSISVSALFLFDSTYFSFYFLCNLCFYSFPFFLSAIQLFFTFYLRENSIFFCIS